MDTVECIDLVVDCLNVSVHQILYAKKLYPVEIFRPHQKFHITVYVSISMSYHVKVMTDNRFFCVQKAIHPEVVTYIDSVMDTLKTLLSDGLVDRFALVVKKDKPIEKYVFHIQSFFKVEAR